MTQDTARKGMHGNAVMIYSPKELMRYTLKRDDIRRTSCVDVRSEATD